MKKNNIKGDMVLLSIVNNKKLDYYICYKGQKWYAFTKNYTTNCHKLCCSGVRLIDLMTRRTKDTGVMKLVNSSNRMLPYLIEFYNIA